MRKALVIGINDYPGSALKFCKNDAIEMKKLLSTNGDGSANFDVKMELDVRQKGKMRNLVAELFSGDDEAVLFYFAGHGCIDGGTNYLVTPDCLPGDCGIQLDDILKMANDSKAKNKIIILDSCFSGAAGSPALFGTGVAYLGEGVTILTACKENETSVEFADHGLFTKLLIEALSGGAADVRGKITFGSIYSYIDQALGPWDQRPVFKTNVSQFLSVRDCIPSVDDTVLREIQNCFHDPNQQFHLDPSYEFTNSTSYKISVVEPFAQPEHVKILETLQKLESISLVEPVEEEHMYFAAMHSKACRLTVLGKHYWYLLKEKRF